VGHNQQMRIEQNPRYLLGGHLGFWLVFKTNLPLEKPNSQKNVPIRSCITTVQNTKSKMSTWMSILGSSGFQKEPSSSGPQPIKIISGKSEQVFLSYWTEANGTGATQYAHAKMFVVGA
jgi:hypothetical protein